MKINYNSQYGSHLLCLAEAFSRTTGPILDFGVGMYSTPFIRLLAEVTGRDVEHVAESEEAAEHFCEGVGRYILCKGEDPRPLFERDAWGVVLLDQGPTGEERWPVAIEALKRSSLVLLHDCQEDQEPIYQYRAKVIPACVAHLIDARVFPPTLVCTNEQRFLVNWPTGPR